MFGFLKVAYHLQRKKYLEHHVPDDFQECLKVQSYSLYILVKGHNVLYEFSLDNEKVIKTNLVFSDDEMIPMNTNHIKDYAKDLPDNLKRYSRPLKVCYELDLVENKVLRDGLSKDEVVSRYMNGGFDRLCPGDIKDIKRIKGLSK